MLGSMTAISPPVVNNESSFSPQLHAASAERNRRHTAAAVQPPTPRLQLGAGTIAASVGHRHGRVTLQDTIATATSLAGLALLNRAI